MLQSEFEARVGMQVNPNEYEHIEAVYLQSDVDKDEFCKLWVKMNQRRVDEAKEKAKEEERKRKLNDRLWHILSKYSEKDWMWKERTLVHTALCKRDEETIKKVGLKLKEWDWQAEAYMYKRMSTMLWEIRNYLKIA